MCPVRPGPRIAPTNARNGVSNARQIGTFVSSAIKTAIARTTPTECAVRRIIVAFNARPTSIARRAASVLPRITNAVRHVLVAPAMTFVSRMVNDVAYWGYALNVIGTRNVRVRVEGHGVLIAGTARLADLTPTVPGRRRFATLCFTNASRAATAATAPAAAATRAPTNATSRYGWVGRAYHAQTIDLCARYIG